MYNPKKYRHLLPSLLLIFLSIAGLLTLPAIAQTASPTTELARVKLPGNEKFSTVAAAMQHCPGDTVVWSTFSKSRVFHFSSSKYYGKTKHGAFACEKDAVAAGYHASKR